MRKVFGVCVVFACMVFAILGADAASHTDETIIYDQAFDERWTAWGWGIESFAFGDGPIVAEILAPGGGVFIEIPDWAFNPGIQAGPEDHLRFTYQELATTTDLELSLIDRQGHETASVRLVNGMDQIRIGELTEEKPVEFNGIKIRDRDRVLIKLSAFSLDKLRLVPADSGPVEQPHEPPTIQPTMTSTLSPEPTNPPLTPTPTVTPMTPEEESADPMPEAAEPLIRPDYQLVPGRLNDQWPASLEAGDVIYLDPGRYTGGNINLEVVGGPELPVVIQKTPGTEGKVIFDGEGKVNTLFLIRGGYIQLGGSRLNSDWEPDMVITRYRFAGLRLYRQAHNLRLHHMHFLENGQGGDGFGIRINGQHILIEFNRFEDNAADALQAETGGGGTDIDHMIIRYNYGLNRMASKGSWAWNYRAHTDFVQIQRGSARNLQLYGNLMLGFTNAVLVGDHWGSVTNLTVHNNLILFESNGISSSSKGDTSGRYLISNNTLILYHSDPESGGSRNAILLKDRGQSEDVTIDCNIFYGSEEALRLNIDGSVNRTSANNLMLGRTGGGFDKINVSRADLGWSMAHGRDLSEITSLTGPAGDSECAAGATFDSVESQLRMIERHQRAFPSFRFDPPMAKAVFVPMMMFEDDGDG